MDGNIIIIVAILSVLIYVFLVYIVAKYGESKRLGFLWTLLIAIFFSPLIAFILAALSGSR